MRKQFLLSVFIVCGGLVAMGFVNRNWWWVLAVVSPIVLLGFYDMFQKKHAINRNFPILGRFRFILESIRPEIGQYFIESDLSGRPFNRRQRSVVYQRAKNVRETVPFGTQLNVKEVGYEWIHHSIYPKKFTEHDPRVKVGSKHCKQPYNASVLNISAMSFGSLSKNAIMALNGGAKLGNFYHNTGEGGVSPYHLKPGGDLVWQIGTAYFGCRDEQGNFSPNLFEKIATLPNVKMIEIKLSQGAKPGHGGMLLAAKNTPEIAAIRHVKPGTDVISPPSHTAFSNAEELLDFIAKLRTLSGGKPIGFKLCVGKKQEFISICEAMKTKGFTPDFITVDGSEGGTGAAPVEFSDHIGMPLYEALAFVHNTLNIMGLRDEIRLIASGRIIGGFDMIKVLSLGADMCNSARGMMMSLGCIQALRCDSGRCPAGVATQDKNLMAGLNVSDKTVRVANYHKKTIHSMIEILEASGHDKLGELNRCDIYRRVEANKIMSYKEIYPYVEVLEMEGMWQ